MNITPSLIRTWVPLLVSFLVSWLLTLGIEVNEESRGLLVSAVSSLIGGAYYFVVRILERRFAWATVLLGSSVQPTEYRVALPPAAAPADPPAPRTPDPADLDMHQDVSPVDNLRRLDGTLP
jgi:hypothetical protein